jgi:hypothetical protein
MYYLFPNWEQIMHELYKIVNSSSESSKELANRYSTEQLKAFHIRLLNLDKANNKVFNNIKPQNGSIVSKLTNVCKAKAKIISLKNAVERAIEIKKETEYQGNGVMVVTNNKINIAITEHIIVQKQELKAVEKEVNLGTSINTDKQFFYNCRQNNMEVTNELSFEIDMMFEPLAPIPLRLQYSTHHLNQEISFEVSFV